MFFYKLLWRHHWELITRARPWLHSEVIVVVTLFKRLVVSCRLLVYILSYCRLLLMSVKVINYWIYLERFITIIWCMRWFCDRREFRGGEGMGKGGGNGDVAPTTSAFPFIRRIRFVCVGDIHLSISLFSLGATFHLFVNKSTLGFGLIMLAFYKEIRHVWERIRAPVFLSPLHPPLLILSFFYFLEWPNWPNDPKNC